MMDLRKEILRKDLLSLYDQNLDERINRYLEIKHQPIIGNHYFAKASTECLELYRDGYFISTILLTQAVCEGIMKFICERNKITEKKERPEILEILKKRKIITEQLADASLKIWKSFRNDYHHMNPKVGKLEHNKIAKNSIKDLAIIEAEIFGFSTSDGGRLIPNQPLYWDSVQKDTVTVFLRLS